MEEAKSKIKRAYNKVYSTLKPLATFLYPLRHTGRENIPKGPAIVCANHSNYIDPVLLAFSFGRENLIHFMAKKEILSVPILGPILRKCGVFPVDRENSDIDAIRTAMKCLRNGEKILIFPEGTRRNTDNAVEAKTGAVRIACKMKVPIIPVCIPRRKKIFGRVTVNIGKPYYVEGSTHEDFLRLSDELMDRINSMQGRKA